MATNYSQLSYGSSGDDVKTLQKMLNNNGYSLDVDGNFGPKTQAAVKEYQKKNNLAVDGIVGKNTWGALNSAASNSAAAAPTSAADMEFSYDPYQESNAVKEANALLAQYQANKPGEFGYSKQDQLDTIMDQYMNRDKFRYDLNGDALYQQYADQYATQGKLAMMDTMGQAAAMTGGYGSSYAQTVGQQTYQGYLQQLNEVVPELYQMAYDQYNQEGQNMLNQYGLLSSERDQEYGVYRDQVSDYHTELQRLTENARYLSESEYNKYLEDLNFKYGMFSDDRSYKYQTERDTVADEQWAAEFEEAQRQYNEQAKLNREQFDWQKKNSGGSSGSSSGGSSGGGKAYSMSASEYEKWNNMWAGVTDNKGAKVLRDNMINAGVPEEIAFVFYDHFMGNDDDDPEGEDTDIEPTSQKDGASGGINGRLKYKRFDWY